jgi:hypothetical protein
MVRKWHITTCLRCQGSPHDSGPPWRCWWCDNTGKEPVPMSELKYVCWCCRATGTIDSCLDCAIGEGRGRR